MTAVSPAEAVEKCTVKVVNRTGLIHVNATGVSGELLWGSESGLEDNAFFNSASCLSGTRARKCELYNPTTLASKTPPAGCTIYVADDRSLCSAWIRGCTPGSREGPAFSTLNSRAEAGRSCSDILDSGESSGDGVYWIDPTGGGTDTFLSYCDMTTEGGGWTLVMNVHPADGGVVSFTNLNFWLTNAEYGQLDERSSHDYKSPAAYLLTAAQIMIQVVEPDSDDQIIGWKAWNMPSQTFDDFFDAPPNTTQTTSVIGSDVANVYEWEPIIKNGDMLQSNRLLANNDDRMRLGVDGYSVRGDDNQPGLGTQMNESHCGVGNNCYRFRDVELWVESANNLWCSAGSPGTHKWVGTDGGCGQNCSDCDSRVAPYLPDYWTYRIYVRE
jgi:hypothetical protein